MGRRSSGAASARKSRKKRKPAKQTKNRQPQKRNATSWKPGQSGNLKGRPPKGAAWAELIRERAWARDITTSTGTKISRRAAVVDRLYSKAIEDGDLTAMRMLFEMGDIEPTGAEVEGGAAVQIFAYLRTAIFRATMDAPEIRERIVKQLDSAIPVDAEEA